MLLVGSYGIPSFCAGKLLRAEVASRSSANSEWSALPAGHLCSWWKRQADCWRTSIHGVCCFAGSLWCAVGPAMPAERSGHWHPSVPEAGCRNGRMSVAGTGWTGCRQSSGFREVVGCFVNTVPVRVTLSDGSGSRPFQAILGGEFGFKSGDQLLH